MKAKSILSLASALLLAASLCAPALAAARRPALICDGDGEGVLWTAPGSTAHRWS